jgi:hypothetical protein
MLGLIAGQEHLTSSWKRFADRIIGLLKAGVSSPTAALSES